MSKTIYNIRLKGYVGLENFDSDFVDYVLEKNCNKPVNVLINSRGGAVDTALVIAAAFKNHGDVSVHFVGFNASAATIASLGAKHISIDRNAMYLVHKCSVGFFEFGSLNADQFDELIKNCIHEKENLDKIDLNIASMYAAKCKKKPQDLLDLMQKGGWLSAQEALDWGFVDEITDISEDEAPKFTEAVAAEMLDAGVPLPNIPIADAHGAFAKFFASIAALFKSNNNTEMTNSADYDARIAELEAQLADRDAHIVELASKIDNLNNDIDELRNSPAEESTQIVDNKEDAPADNSFSAFFDTSKKARELFNSVP